jgi:hypothetical protein
VLKFEPNPKLNVGHLDGVTVQPYSSRSKDEQDLRDAQFSNAAANALLAFLDSNNWDAVKSRGWTNIAPNTIKISVGLKPLTYFQEKGWKDMREKMKELQRKFGKP